MHYVCLRFGAGYVRRYSSPGTRTAPVSVKKDRNQLINKNMKNIVSLWKNKETCSEKDKSEN